MLCLHLHTCVGLQQRKTEGWQDVAGTGNSGSVQSALVLLLGPLVKLPNIELCDILYLWCS